MTTRKILPRADGEGSLGTTIKKWNNVLSTYLNNTPIGDYLLSTQAGRKVTSSVNVYLSPTGSDTTGDGTSGNPYFSLRKAGEYIRQYAGLFKAMNTSYDYKIIMSSGTFNYTTSHTLTSNAECGFSPSPHPFDYTFNGVNSFSISGAGIANTIINYNGDSSTPLIYLENCYLRNLSNMRINHSSGSSGYILKIDNCFVNQITYIWLQNCYFLTHIKNTVFNEGFINCTFNGFAGIGVYLNYNSIVRVYDSTFTNSGGGFSTALAANGNSFIFLGSGCTFTGISTNGIASNNSLINVNTSYSGGTWSPSLQDVSGGGDNTWSNCRSAILKGNF